MVIDVTERHQRGRGGRPSAQQAGEVDERILDAASALFLERGFEATSFERVAAYARAGKASLYARFEHKEAMFTAVVQRQILRSLSQTRSIPAARPLDERLSTLGIDILQHSLQPNVVALMRVIVAEAARLPTLAQQADRLGWEHGVSRVAEVIACRHPDTASATLQARQPAERFIDLVFPPHQMRALMGIDLDVLLDQAPQKIEEVLTLMHAAGWLKGWT